MVRSSAIIGVAIRLASACAVPPTGPNSVMTPTQSCGVAATLSMATFTEAGGEALLSIRTSSACDWQVSLPDWIRTTAALSGSGDTDLGLAIERSNSDRSGAILVGRFRAEVVQQAAIRIQATCFSGRPGDVVPLACTAWIEHRRKPPVTPQGRIWADFSAMGQSGKRFGPYTAGNADWDVPIPADQPVGKVTIPIHLEYGDGFVATAFPEFNVLPRR